MKRMVKYKEANHDMGYWPWDDRVPAESDFLPSPLTKQYTGNKVYENNSLKLIRTENGYIEKTGGTYTRYYYLRDHLGNNRIVMNASGNVVQMTNYYPSGTVMAELPVRTDQGVQPYKFGDKELDRSNGLDFYDFAWRQYDPTLMRFTTPDPLAEKYYSVSPYVYCLNNPVRYTDPTGMWIPGADGKPITYDEENGWSTNASEDVRKIGDAMMQTPEGKKVFDDMTATKYSITIKYKEGFHPEIRDKLGETRTIYDESGEITDVTINLFDGKIRENVAEYQQAHQSGLPLKEPTEYQQELYDATPTMTERIGQVGTHEGTHATNPQAMYHQVGAQNAERTATAVEMKVIKYSKPIRANLKLIQLIKK
jgi:RHS repeat-associated protein